MTVVETVCYLFYVRQATISVESICDCFSVSRLIICCRNCVLRQIMITVETKYFPRKAGSRSRCSNDRTHDCYFLLVSQVMMATETE